MQMQKKHWWMILLALILSGAVLLAVFWDTVSVYLAPKTVLHGALTNTIAQLTDRFSGSPVLVLTKALDKSGCNRVQLELDTRKPLLGDIHYDMQLQTRMAPKQVLARGTATAGGRELDLSLYLDGNFAAVSSDSLLESRFYGITYDTFSQDIRTNRVLTFILGEDTISQWEQSVETLQSAMEGSLEPPKISMDDVKMAVTGLLALKADVSRETIPLLRGDQLCFRIHMEADGAMLLAAMDYTDMELPFAVTEDSLISADFYLAENHVVRIDLDVTGGGEEYHICLSPDLHPDTDSLNFRYSHTSGLQTDSFGATISTISSDTVYTEKVSLNLETGEDDRDFVLHYSWNSDTGDASLSRQEAGEEYAAQMKLLPLEDGFRMETGDLDAILAVLGEGEDKSDTPCSMTVGKGSDFQTPDYKNISQWSLDDLLTLLGSVGSLLGIHTE